MTLKNKLPKRIKARWVKALRSGKYIQGTEHLVQPHYENNTGIAKGKEYCCIGVLGKLCGISDRTLKTKNLPYDLNPISRNKFPKILQTDLEDDLTGKQTIVGKLVNMNDERSWSFKSIADYIEKHL